MIDADRGDLDSRPDRLTVAIIHYQTPELLSDCLARVQRAAPAARVIVVDTGDSAALPDEWPAANSGVELLRHANRGYASAVNAALVLCTSEFFVQMNADVFVESSTFDDLLDVLQQGPALVGPTVRTASGALQDQGLPYRLHYRKLAHAVRRHAAPGQPWVPVNWVSGCLQAVRCDAVEQVGSMDEDFRFYNEDVEWCLRFREQGFSVALTSTSVTHLAGSSTPARPEFMVEGLRGGYLVTKRYGSPVAAGAQRAFVLAWAAFGSVLARSSVQRSAFRQAFRMFLRGDFTRSPFGATLRDAR